MALLKGQGAIDELGLGRIRDAFSNKMFPGMSTLQTRGKYFLLMPALYAYLERTRIADAKEARAKIREHEIALTKRLCENNDDDRKGIIGAESLERGRQYVKYDPAYVYQAGLETYGMITTGGNLYSMIAERSKIYQNLPKKHRNEGEEGEDSDDLAGLRPIFLTCGEEYDFGGKSPLPIKLTRKEAEFLKRQIIKHTPGSLLGYLLDSGLYESVKEYDFEELEVALRDKIPADLYKTYILARRYSRFAQLLRIRYAMLYDIAVGAERAEEEEKGFFTQLETFKDEFRPEAIEEIIQHVEPLVSDPNSKQFCRRASRLIAEEDWTGLDELIVKREIEIKGMKRSKLRNADEYEPGKPFEIAGAMSFRWNTIVRTVLSEVSC